MPSPPAYSVEGTFGSMARHWMYLPYRGSHVQTLVSAARVAGTPTSTPERLRVRHKIRIIVTAVHKLVRAFVVFMPCSSWWSSLHNRWIKTRSPPPSSCDIGMVQKHRIHFLQQSATGGGCLSTCGQSNAQTLPERTCCDIAANVDIIYCAKMTG